MDTSENIIDFYQPKSLASLLVRLQFNSVLSDLDRIKEYVFDNKHIIKSHQTDFIKRVDDEVKKYPTQEFEIREHFEDQYYQYYDTYPALYRNSTLLTIYSYFENQLYQLCETISQNTEGIPKFEQPKGNYIGSCKKYLTSSFGLNLNHKNILWHKITDYQKVRNAIAHSHGSVYTMKGKKIEEQPLYKIIQKTPAIELDGNSGNFKIINDQYLVDFCDITNEYLNVVLQLAEDKLKTAV